VGFGHDPVIAQLAVDDGEIVERAPVFSCWHKREA
jgi:hypothetical protein